MKEPDPHQVARERTAFVLGLLMGIVLGALSFWGGVSHAFRTVLG